MPVRELDPVASPSVTNIDSRLLPVPPGSRKYHQHREVDDISFHVEVVLNNIDVRDRPKLNVDLGCEGQLLVQFVRGHSLVHVTSSNFCLFLAETPTLKPASLPLTHFPRLVTHSETLRTQYVDQTDCMMNH